MFPNIRSAHRLMTASILFGLFTLGNRTAFSESLPLPKGVLKNEFLFDKAPFPSCHASTIVELPNRSLVVAFFSGTHERNPDVVISICRTDGTEWTAPVEVANGIQTDEKRFPCWNPVLYLAAEDDLWLFYKVGPDPRSWWGMLKKSRDGGKTWSEAQRLPEGILGPIKNKPVTLRDGTILSPTSTEDQGWRVHFERTTDRGANWTRSEPVNDGKAISAIQPSILFLGQERLMALGRTKQKRVFTITSNDLGKTWGEISLSMLPNPSSGTDAVTMRDGSHALIYNHSEAGRTPLNLAFSKDGVHWEMAAVLENGPAEPGSGFGYPAIIQSADGLLHITYTWRRQKIRHAVVDPSRVELSPIPHVQ